MSRRRAKFGEVFGPEPGSRDERISALDAMDPVPSHRRLERLGRLVVVLLVPVLGCAAVVVMIVAVVQNGSGSTAQGAGGDPGAGPMLLKVGDCFQYPANGVLNAVPPVPCSAMHTAQLFGVNSPEACDAGAIKPGVLPSDAETVYQVVQEQTGDVPVCLLEFSPTTGSAMAS
jgi:hypothetical protein